MYDIYFIEPGDTIESIANKVGTSIDVLENLNPGNSFAVEASCLLISTFVCVSSFNGTWSATVLLCG